MTNLNIQSLKNWFLTFKRDLPWRRTNDPYCIWISEIMLQQTQVAVVVPYYLRWMTRFPTIQSLADATLEEVIKMWEGLGYYSRARNLHEGARYIVENFNGCIPNQESDLIKIKGLGPYTIGAILSFAFHQKKAAVDGNVLRVVSRYYEFHDDIAKTSTQKKFRHLIEELLPNDESWIVNEALIELGATVCQKKPKCQICPLSNNCMSYRNGTEQLLPVKSKGPATTNLYRIVTILKHQDYYLVKKGEKGAVMADLYEFPFIETAQPDLTQEEQLQKIKQNFSFNTFLIKSLPAITHGFTRYKVLLNPHLLEVSECEVLANYEWHAFKDLIHLPFSSGHRRIFQHLLAHSIQ